MLGLLLAPAISPAQNSGSAGAFSRLGFGARGMGMGNAMTGNANGSVQSYYNPALAAFASDRTVSATFSFLSFDRSLNFLSYTQAIKPTGGISLGLINAGVKNIDGRDYDGMHTEDYSTFENEFYLAFANRITDNFALGLTVKMYYSKLFDEIKNSTVGFDAGALYRFSPRFSVGAVLQDISSKYTWDTRAIYDIDGRTTVDKFPQLRRVGVSYTPDSLRLILSADIENSSLGTNTVRVGAEYTFNAYFAARAGVDRFVMGDNSFAGTKPTFGFTVKNAMGRFVPALNYAYIVEPFSSQGMHILTLSTTF